MRSAGAADDVVEATYSANAPAYALAFVRLPRTFEPGSPECHRAAAGAARWSRAAGGGIRLAYSASPPAETPAYGPRIDLRLDSTGTLRYGARIRMELRPDSAVAWLLEQTERFLTAGFIPAGVGQARPGRHA